MKVYKTFNEPMNARSEAALVSASNSNNAPIPGGGGGGGGSISAAVAAANGSAMGDRKVSRMQMGKAFLHENDFVLYFLNPFHCLRFPNLFTARGVSDQHSLENSPSYLYIQQGCSRDFQLMGSKPL